MVTVRDVWKLALPAGTELVAGESGLGREVTWVTSLRPRPPAFEALKGGEIALVSLSALKVLDERVTLAELLDRLRGMGVVAIAVSSGAPDRAAIDASESLGVPLFALPTEVMMNEVEREITRLLAERRSDMYTRSQDLNRQLMEMAIEGKGVAALVQALAQISGKCVVVQDDDFLPRFHEIPEAFPAVFDEIMPLLEANRASVATWLDGIKLSPSDPPTTIFDLPKAGMASVIAPVATRDCVMAYLYLVGRVDEITELDHVTASRGAAALAVEFARERAVLDAEDRMQESFVDSLLNGSYPGPDVVLSRARRLGYDLTVPHAVIVFRLSHPKTTSEIPSGPGDRLVLGRKDVEQVLQREIHRRGVEAPVRIKGESVAVLYPVRTYLGERQAKDLAEELRENLATSLGTQTSAGIGRLHKGVEGVRIAYREAEQAVSLGIRLFGKGSSTYFGDLGLHRLLLSVQCNQELRTFYGENLGKLAEYDRKNGSELIKTLEAFFAACGSPTDAAVRLHLHRNTLLYRLHRIREISGLDLDDPEVRLSIHLALRIGQALAASRAASVH